jgi:hypothetical protein
MTGAELIIQERQRQIDVEGWTVEHDGHHQNGELIAAAIFYADEATSAMEWPWDELPRSRGDDRIRDLTKAGALIAAEIDRLVRAELEERA